MTLLRPNALTVAGLLPKHPFLAKTPHPLYHRVARWSSVAFPPPFFLHFPSLLIVPFLLLTIPLNPTFIPQFYSGLAALPHGDSSLHALVYMSCPWGRSHVFSWCNTRAKSLMLLQALQKMRYCVYAFPKVASLWNAQPVPNIQYLR